MSSRFTLLLGFSYSLEADGSPGSYNDDIAMAMSNWMHRGDNDHDEVLVACQWEIADALVRRQADVQPFSAPPPSFTAGDIVDADRIVGLLLAGESEGARQLSGLLCERLRGVGYESDDDGGLYAQAGLTAERLAMYLSTLLPDRTMYRRFGTNVELHDLHRNALGALGFEARRMPTGDGELLPFQAMRVNRLIIEAVIPHEEILRRGAYLSTDGVLERVLGHFRDKLAEIRAVRVFAFPGHAPRCCRQTMEALWRAGRTDIDVKNDRATARNNWGALPWDAETAQIWCRSLQNWLDYERMGLRRR